MKTSRGAAFITAQQGVANLDEFICCLRGLVACGGQVLSAAQQGGPILTAKWPR